MNKVRSIKFSYKSMMDNFGRVFFHDGKVYRAIYKESIPNCLELLGSDLFKELTNEGLIPYSEVSNFILPDFALILEHEKLNEVLQHEWSFEMLKQSALNVLKVNEICNKYGFELKDAHTFNILFRGVTPVYADLGSISKKTGKSWNAYQEFICVFYLPLLFWEQEEIYIVRKLVESNFYKLQTIPFQDILDSNLISVIHNKPFNYCLNFRNITLICNSKYIKIFSIISRILNRTMAFLLRRPIILFTYNRNLLPIDIIQNKIKNISLKTRKSEWANYHKNNYAQNNVFLPSKRFLRILEIIKLYEGEINSVLDLAGNEGLFTMLLLERTKIQKIFLADYDMNAIDSAFNKFKFENSNRVTVALLNFIFTLDIENTANRFKSDIVVALAITHHLILTQKYSLDVIFERLRIFTKKYVLVEFMPLGLWSKNSNSVSTIPEWYNFSWFKLKFENYFDLIITENLEDNRIIFLGKLKYFSQ